MTSQSSSVSLNYVNLLVILLAFLIMYGIRFSQVSVNLKNLGDKFHTN